MNYNTLYELITHLEYGTKLHIGVLFFGNYGNEYLAVPYEHTIHSREICQDQKTTPKGFKKCYACKTASIRKALKDKKPFGGLCINGVYEYIRPITENGNVICIIFIGNIMPNKDCIRILKSTKEKPHLSDTMEHSYTEQQCEKLGALIENHIRLLLKAYPEESNNTDFHPLIENLKSFINSNLEYDIEISALAKIFNYNELYLGRLFKKKTGMSIRNYINLKRLETARKLLTETEDSIINISMRSGFNNVTYFNRVFKKTYNQTPSEYRANK